MGTRIAATRVKSSIDVNSVDFNILFKEDFEEEANCLPLNFTQFHLPKNKQSELHIPKFMMEHFPEIKKQARKLPEGASIVRSFPALSISNTNVEGNKIYVHAMKIHLFIFLS